MTTKLNDVYYGIRNGNISRGALNEDGITGYVMNGVAVSGKIALGDVKTVYTLKDVTDLGLDAAYDTANTVLVYHHLKKHFSHNPRIETKIMLVAQSVTLTQMADKTNQYAKKLLVESNGRVKILGLIRNPATGYTATITNGMDADSYGAFAKAQELVTDEMASFRLLPTVFIEVRSMSNTASAWYNLRTMVNRNITGVGFQDPAVAAGNALFGGYAAVGDACGLASRAAVSQNIGERTSDFQLQDKANGYFLTCALSSGQLVTVADLDTAMDKGYCFAHSLADFDGFWINDYPTSVAITDDYCYGYLNRVAFKALQFVRKKILPLVSNNKLQTNPDNGKLTDSFRTYLEEVAAAEIQRQIEAPGDAIAGSARGYINPDVDVRAANGNFTIEISFTEITLGKKITLNLGFNS